MSMGKKSITYFCACLSALLLFGNLALGQDSTISYLRNPEGRIREHNVDFLKMVLDVKFDTKAGRVIGDVKYEFKPIQFVVDTLFMDAPGIDIKKVLLNGKEVTFTKDSAGLTIRFYQPIDWNKKYDLEISYEVEPRKGLYFIGWNVDAKNIEKDPYFTRKQIWTQGEGADNRFWIPCYDDVNDKLLTETIITFDSSYTVVSNGTLKEKKRNADGTLTWHYAMNKPMVPYLIMIAIDKYAYKDYVSKGGVVSREYYYMDRPEVVATTYKHSAEMMDFLASETGFHYPWLTYSNSPVQDFMYGAMENTTATIYGDFLQVDARAGIDRDYEGVNAHELTHQWFGDCITAASWQHLWLHESFATYYSKQFMRKMHGEDSYEWAKRGEQMAAIATEKNDRFPISNTKAGTARIYPKGSFVLDMLRYVVGDSVFKHSITHYLQKHAYDNVTGNDFMMAFMETAGVNLDWFFDEWIYRAGLPNYSVKYELQKNNVVFYVSQTQRMDNLTGAFKMPVVFEVHYKDGSSASKKVWLSNVNDTVYVSAPAGGSVDFALFDPGAKVLKNVDFKKEYDELGAQLVKAKNMIDKYDALVALRDVNIDKKRDLLIAVYNEGNYSAIQNEIIKQLSKDRNPSTLGLMARALKDKEFTTRRAVVEQMDSIPEVILPAVEQLLQDSSFTTIEITLHKLAKLYPAKLNTYLDATKGVRGVAENVRIAWLELSSGDSAVSVANNHKFEKQIVPFASNQYEFRTRLRAFDALERLGYSDRDLIYNLFNASLYNNSRLANPAMRLLKTILKRPDQLVAAKEVLAANKWKDWEKKALDGYFK
jgi:aminopeptidase N